MWLRIRQICLVAEKLEPVVEELKDVLGIEECYRDPGVGIFGLENALLPIGNQLLEVVSPIEEGTAAGRYLVRRGGDGGYMVITQCDDHAPRRRRVEDLGIRLIHEFETHEFTDMQLHPRDTGGCLFEIDQVLGPNAHDLDGPWEPAGPNWKSGQRLDRVDRIAAAEIQADNPAAVAARWAEIAEQNLLTDNAGNTSLKFDNADLRFFPCTDGRPEGLGCLDIGTTDKAAILQAADKRGAVIGDNQISLCGMRINLI
jgi:hypothetical protein